MITRSLSTGTSFVSTSISFLSAVLDLCLAPQDVMRLLHYMLVFERSSFYILHKLTIILAYRKNGTQDPERTQDPGP